MPCVVPIASAVLEPLRATYRKRLAEPVPLIANSLIKGDHARYGRYIWACAQEVHQGGAPTLLNYGAKELVLAQETYDLWFITHHSTPETAIICDRNRDATPERA